MDKLPVNLISDQLQSKLPIGIIMIICSHMIRKSTTRFHIHHIAHMYKLEPIKVNWLLLCNNQTLKLGVLLKSKTIHHALLLDAQHMALKKKSQSSSNTQMIHSTQTLEHPSLILEKQNFQPVTTGTSHNGDEYSLKNENI